MAITAGVGYKHLGDQFHAIVVKSAFLTCLFFTAVSRELFNWAALAFA
jgi:hypothetical protein